MTKSINTVKTVQVNGVELLDFMPQLESQGAIVPLSVIQRLASLLKSSSLESVIRNHVEVIESINIRTIQDYVETLQNELDFHKTVNLLTMYEKPQAIEEQAVVAKY